MSMLLPPFQLHEPTTLKEALELKTRHPESDVVAGGTDLLPNYKWGLNARPHVGRIPAHAFPKLLAGARGCLGCGIAAARREKLVAGRRA